MKRILPKLTALLLLAFYSCQLPKAGSIDSIVNLYGGTFSLESGIRASTSEGKENYAKLVCENNNLISNGWLSSEAMANNCAILLIKANPDILDKNDFLEVEFPGKNQQPYSYKKNTLNGMESEYHIAEKMVVTFVSSINSNDLERAKAMMETSSTLSESDLTTFLTTFKNVNLPNYKETKLIGFRQIGGAEKSYAVDFFIISQDDVQKMANAVLMATGNGLRFREVNF